MEVTLTDLAFSFNNFSPLTPAVPNGPLTLGIVGSVAGPTGGVTLRPGIAGVTLTVNSSAPGVVSVPSPQVLFPAGTTGVTFSATPLAPGQATLSLSVPAPYLMDSHHGTVSMTVSEATLNLFSGTLGNDLHGSYSLAASAGNFSDSPFVMLSTDPTRLLIWSDPTVTGQGSLSIQATPNRHIRYYLQALTGEVR